MTSEDTIVPYTPPELPNRVPPPGDDPAGSIWMSSRRGGAGIVHSAWKFSNALSSSVWIFDVLRTSGFGEASERGRRSSSAVGTPPPVLSALSQHRGAWYPAYDRNNTEC